MVRILALYEAKLQKIYATEEIWVQMNESYFQDS